MKSLCTIIVAAVLGTGIGIGISVAEFRGQVDFLDSHNGSQEQVQQESKPLKAAKFVVQGGTVFNFGTMERYATREHTFQVSNEGNAPLEITRGDVSCSLCISTDFEDVIIQPGKQAPITIRYSTRKEVAEFSEGLTITTNDTERRHVQLRIEGLVVADLKVIPRQIALPGISAKEDTHISVKIFSFVQQPLEILGHELLYQDSADAYEVTIEPLPRDILAEEKNARTGILLKITIKAGQPIAPFRQTVQLRTNIDESSELEIPIVGSVQGDVRVVGIENNMINLGVVDQAAGVEKRFFILVKGEHRESVEIKVKETNPAKSLQVVQGQRGVQSASVRFPFTLKIPPGSEPISRMGKTQEDLGLILLETTHPDDKIIKIYVRFSIQ